MSMFRRPKREVPSLNTASLPDLIFTVLFFFMLVTHMRTDTVSVRLQQPKGTELTTIGNKQLTLHIYIGKPNGGNGESVIEMNDRYVSPSDIEKYVGFVVKDLSPDERERLTVSLKADRGTKMSVINDVKQALRRAGALRISYSADDLRKGKKVKR